MKTFYRIRSGSTRVDRVTEVRRTTTNSWLLNNGVEERVLLRRCRLFNTFEVARSALQDEWFRALKKATEEMERTAEKLAIVQKLTPPEDTTP